MTSRELLAKLKEKEKSIYSWYGKMYMNYLLECIWNVVYSKELSIENVREQWRISYQNQITTRNSGFDVKEEDLDLFREAMKDLESIEE